MVSGKRKSAKNLCNRRLCQKKDFAQILKYNEKNKKYFVFDNSGSLCSEYLSLPGLSNKCQSTWSMKS